MTELHELNPGNYRSYLVVCSNIKDNRKALERRNTTHGCVQGQLSHWNAHSKGTKISKTKNSLPISHNNCLKWQPPQYAYNDNHHKQFASNDNHQKHLSKMTTTTPNLPKMTTAINNLSKTTTTLNNLSKTTTNTNIYLKRQPPQTVCLKRQHSWTETQPFGWYDNAIYCNRGYLPLMCCTPHTKNKVQFNGLTNIGFMHRKNMVLEKHGNILRLKQV